MSKPKSYERAELTRRAMERFWRHGFYATSIRDLVEAAGVSRHGLYTEFGDKNGIFLAALEMYLANFVQQVFGRVETETADVRQIRAYFEHLIDLAETAGLPGPGCLMANTMVESAPHEEAFREIVWRHLDRIKRGFTRAISNGQRLGTVDHRVDAERYAEFLAISAQGLWSVSRVTDDAAVLRAYVDALLAPLETGAGS